MTTPAVTDRPIRAAVFDSVEKADAVVAELLAAGFTEEQVTVMCSEQVVQRHFQRFEHQDPAGTNTPAAALTGGACGAGVGAVAAVALASVVSLGGVALLAAGGIAIWSGGVVGGLIGAMMTRGVEKELADYYDQAVAGGKILVAAEEEDSSRLGILDRAAEIFARHGAEAIPLVEG